MFLHVLKIQCCWQMYWPKLATKKSSAKKRSKWLRFFRGGSHQQHPSSLDETTKQFDEMLPSTGQLEMKYVLLKGLMINCDRKKGGWVRRVSVEIPDSWSCLFHLYPQIVTKENLRRYKSSDTYKQACIVGCRAGCNCSTWNNAISCIAGEHKTCRCFFFRVAQEWSWPKGCAINSLHYVSSFAGQVVKFGRIWVVILHSPMQVGANRTSADFEGEPYKGTRITQITPEIIQKLSLIAFDFKDLTVFCQKLGGTCGPIWGIS